MIIDNQLNNRSYKISIIQKQNKILQLEVKSCPSLKNSIVVIGHTSSMWSTDRTFIQNCMSHSDNI